MEFDFDTRIERRGTDSVKWHDAGDVLPMWVADMDFRTAPAVIAALEERTAHGIFGYAAAGDAYYEAVTGWFARRHGVRFAREAMIVTSGVVPAISAILRALCRPGDGVIVQTPAYNGFFSSIRNLECVQVDNPLILRAGRYEMDFDDLERKAADPRARVLLLCNPHNPGGRVWTRTELERLAAICQRHGVTVVSDEIHCDLAFAGHPYTPFASLGEDIAQGSVTCVAASKAFNIAGLQNAVIVANDAHLRARIDKAINIHEVCDVNPFGIAATTAAYTRGEEWLAALTSYLEGNHALLRETFAAHLPGLDVMQQESTYLAWVDCRALGMPSQQIVEELMVSARVRLNAGTVYGAAGEGFVRINFACPRPVLADGLDRIVKGLSQIGRGALPA